MPRYVFGPLLSRRLGLSLGVDLCPPKTCAWNCTYCQLGRTRLPTLERAECVPTNEVLRQLAEALRNGPRPDHVTITGSGEPTLHAGIDRVITGAKALSPAPVALLTSGALMWQSEVRRACAGADVILPTLASWNESLYQQVHRPGAGLTHERHVAGLASLCREFAGQVWLEVFLLPGVNTADADLAGLAREVERIRPHRVQLNTAVRPTAERSATAAAADKLQEWATRFNPVAEVIAEWAAPSIPVSGDPAAATRPGCPAAVAERIKQLCRRHPCTIAEIARLESLSEAAVSELLDSLTASGELRQALQDGRSYFSAQLN